MTVHKQSEAGNRGENAVRVCVRVRPLNDRERKSGAVNCVAFDAQTHQVVLHAPPNHNFHKNHGKPRHGFAFDHSYGPKGSSRDAYADCVAPLVENVAKVWQHSLEINTGFRTVRFRNQDLHPFHPCAGRVCFLREQFASAKFTLLYPFSALGCMRTRIIGTTRRNSAVPNRAD